MPPGTVLTAAAEGIDVVCGSGILRIRKLQLAGRKALAAAEFLRGQRLSGTRFSDS
jgi:methionyl-tRNA formyltransferase